MELGLVMICLADRSWEDALDTAIEFGIKHLEPCSGGYFPRHHYDARVLVEDSSARKAFADAVRARELEIACLSACANPLHPDKDRAKEAHENFVATCQLANELEVPLVGVLSGCPGGGPEDRTVNWITPVLSDDPYPDAQLALEWQWENRAIPYWREAASIAEQYGVALSMEPIAGNIVYDATTFSRLRESTGPAIGALFDPSHFFWQGFDIEQLVATFGNTINYAHAKDVRIDRVAVKRDGLVPPVAYDAWDARSWGPRTPGLGHDASFWARYISALRRTGYEGPITIEIEEPYMSVDDALRLAVATLQVVVPRDPMPTGNWFEAAYGQDSPAAS
jgi:sugar phosphate isomerase/epimerase